MCVCVLLRVFLLCLAIFICCVYCDNFVRLLVFDLVVVCDVLSHVFACSFVSWCCLFVVCSRCLVFEVVWVCFCLCVCL